MLTQGAAENKSKSMKFMPNCAGSLILYMYGISHLLTYGIILAAEHLRMGLGNYKEPALTSTVYSANCIRRLADRLGLFS